MNLPFPPPVFAEAKPSPSWGIYYLQQLSVDLGQFLVIAGIFFLIFYIALPRALFHRKVQAAFPARAEMHREVLLSLQSVAIFAAFGVLIVFLYKMGWTRLYRGVEPYGWIYLVASLPLFLLIQDTWFYWAHRFLHWRPIYKSIHHVHHKSHNPTPWAAFSFHPLEAALNALIFPLVVVLIPINLWVEWIWFFTMFLISVYLHLGYEIMPGSSVRHWLGRWPTGAMHHNMHHSHFNWNYGLYFTIWDWLMSTTHPDFTQRFDEVSARISPGTAGRKERQETTPEVPRRAGR